MSALFCISTLHFFNLGKLFTYTFALLISAENNLVLCSTIVCSLSEFLKIEITVYLLHCYLKSCDVSHCWWENCLWVISQILVIWSHVCMYSNRVIASNTEFGKSYLGTYICHFAFTWTYVMHYNSNLIHFLLAAIDIGPIFSPLLCRFLTMDTNFNIFY